MKAQVLEFSFEHFPLFPHRTMEFIYPQRIDGGFPQLGIPPDPALPSFFPEVLPHDFQAVQFLIGLPTDLPRAALIR